MKNSPNGTTEIDRLRAMIDATSGEVQKEFIKARKELNHSAIEYEKEYGIHYIPGSQFFKGSENPLMKESLEDGPRLGRSRRGTGLLLNGRNQSSTG